MQNTKIEWADSTWNPWMGCAKVSPACDHCYAEALMDKRHGRVEWGQNKLRVRTGENTWREPRRWNRSYRPGDRRKTVFCLSLGDIWDNEVDPKWRADAFDVMRQTRGLVYLLLSKRIGNAVHMAREAGGLPPNCALGATVVNQTEWDRDVPKLLEAAYQLRALFSFASIEPMLGPVDMTPSTIDWVICGGESGPHARPMNEAWARDLASQCKAAGVAFFMKQMHVSGKLVKDIESFPDDLRVREFPNARAVS